MRAGPGVVTHCAWKLCLCEWVWLVMDRQCCAAAHKFVFSGQQCGESGWEALICPGAVLQGGVGSVSDVLDMRVLPGDAVRWWRRCCWLCHLPARDPLIPSGGWVHHPHPLVGTVTVRLCCGLGWLVGWRWVLVCKWLACRCCLPGLLVAAWLLRW